MIRLSVEEIKKKELKMLQYIDCICKENNIKYFLCGGTLIGAIRHHGFIPWDDDMDIILARPDYMRLIELLKNDKNYKSISLYNNSDYCYSFAKIVDNGTVLYENNTDFDINGLGVYIDLFPLDGLPDGEMAIQKYYKKIMQKRTMLYLSLESSSPESSTKIKFIVKNILWRYARLKTWKYWLNEIEKMTRMYDYESSKMIGCQCAGYGIREVFSKEAFSKAIRAPFEEDEFNIPIGYEEYLTKLYGDYMKLPPKEQQVTRHEMEAYEKE